jgi:hypothetical protein
MKSLFEAATKSICVCGHPRPWHCQPGSSGFWQRRGRFKTLIRCHHSAAFATDERAVCTSDSCAVPGCPCIGMPAPKPRKKKQEGAA